MSNVTCIKSGPKPWHELTKEEKQRLKEKENKKSQ